MCSIAVSIRFCCADAKDEDEDEESDEGEGEDEDEEEPKEPEDVCISEIILLRFHLIRP